MDFDPKDIVKYRHTKLQIFRNDLRLYLVRPTLLAIGQYLQPVVPEKLHRSRYRETPVPYLTGAESQVSRSCRRWVPYAAYDVLPSVAVDRSSIA
jgi:hypothetical protein